MAAIKLKWSSLLNITELEFIPAPPKVLEVSDELLQSISWLTAATRHDRKLLRCTENGALLVVDAWCGLSSVETAELYSPADTLNSDSPIEIHRGVLIATSTQLVKMSFVRKGGGVAEHCYIPPASYYWYPYPVLTVTAAVVPVIGGTASYVGVTYFN